MRLTVLGGSAAWPNPGQGCSSYLVEHAGYWVLLDCGSNTVLQLRHYLQYWEVDTILISHLHSDHTLDLVPFRYGLKYAAGSPGRRVELLMPPGGREFLGKVAAAFAFGSEDPRGFFEDVFDVAEYEPEQPRDVGPIGVSFHPTLHFIPCWAMRLEAGGRSLTYFVDTAPYAPLQDFGRDSDLVICEATLPESSGTPGEPSSTGHLTARQAGAIAREAGAGTLLLTHMDTGLDRDQMAAAARQEFGGHVVVAKPGVTIDV